MLNTIGISSLAMMVLLVQSEMATKDQSILLFSLLLYFPVIIIYPTYCAQSFAYHQLICSKV